MTAPARCPPERRTDVLFAAGLAAALLLPRVELYDIGGGIIRPEDLLLAYMVALGVLSGRLRYTCDGIDRAVFLFVGVQVAAAVLASSSGRTSLLPALLFAVRPLEYWLVRPLADAFVDSTSGGRLLRFYPAVLLGTALVLDAGALTGGRVSAGTGGPYELAAISGVLVLTAICAGRPGRAVLPGSLVVLAQSRSGVLAVGVGLAVHLVLAARRRGTAATVRSRATGIGLVVLVLAVNVTAVGGAVSGQLLDRVTTGARVSTSWAASGEIARALPRPVVSGDTQTIVDSAFGDLASFDREADASSVVRYTKWRVLLGAASGSYMTTVLGLGPSFSGPAVDGYYVRVFAEAGLVGVAAFAWLVVCLVRAGRSRSPVVLLLVAVLLTHGLFIDVWVSSKVMLLFWFLIAHSLPSTSPARGPSPPLQSTRPGRRGSQSRRAAPARGAAQSRR